MQHHTFLNMEFKDFSRTFHLLFYQIEGDGMASAQDQG